MSQAKVARTGSDLLSPLPEDVKLNILECLPLQDAVRTGILSTHWRNKWTKLPQITLDRNFFLAVNSGLSYTRNFSTSYLDIAENVLFRHVGPLRKFVLYFSHHFSEARISAWLRFVSRKGISEFKFENGFAAGYIYLLPSSVLSFEGLTCLTLQGIAFSELPSPCTVFTYLVSLELIKCDWESGKVLESIISSCPRLRLLRFSAMRPLNVTIQAPKLEHLFFYGFNHSRFCLGNNSTNIRTLHLECPCFHIMNNVFFVLENLYLGPQFFTSLCSYSGNEGVTDLLRLETQSLELIDVQLFEPLISSIVLKLLNSSHPLKRLYCKVSEVDLPLSREDALKLKCSVSNFETGNFPSLKYVKVVGFGGSSTELQFIKKILEYAPVLEIMTIMLGNKVKNAEDKLKITTTLLQYSRASRKAQIIFKT